jgi:hypothetical protein
MWRICACSSGISAWAVGGGSHLLRHWCCGKVKHSSLRCRSWTRTSVRASACRAAARRRRMVPTGWPVIASAALRLPRRITTNRVRATSAGVTRQRSIAVPRVGPNERPPFRQTQRGRPPLLPFWITWVAPRRGQGGFWGWGFRFIGPTSVGIWPRLYRRALLRGATTWVGAEVKNGSSGLELRQTDNSITFLSILSW